MKRLAFALMMAIGTVEKGRSFLLSGILLVALDGLAAMPVPANVPELMTCEDGTKVSSVAQWEGKRRGEILEFFTREEYGRRPVERPADLKFEAVEPDKVMMSGRAIRKRVRAHWTGPRGDWSFVFTAFVPKRAADAGLKSPSFVLICNRSVENIDPTREKKSYFWPAEEIVDRGYAAIAFWNGDLAPDDRNPVFTNGVYRIYGDRGEDTWGALSAWAWGASRVMDWIETEPTLDARHVGVVGHSRGGKTALVAGVTDRRFAMACSNCSGCSGAKLNHIDLPKSESIRIITGAFRHWFSLKYDAWADREAEMPYDQHEWIALMAPRLVAVASAGEDNWAGQLGEFHAARLASPAWELYGRKGLVAPAEPPTVGDRPADGLAYQEGSVSYHIRPGEHTLSAYDWHRYLDFADRHGWRDAARCEVVEAARLAGPTPADTLLRVREQVREIWRAQTNAVIVLKAGPDEVVNRELRRMADGKAVIWTNPEKGKPLTVPARRATRPLSRFDAKNFGLKAWWLDRLAKKRAQIRASGGKIDLVMFGDSITHHWENAGAESLRELEKSWSVLDIGYGGDRTDNLLWRGENGELDGYQAKCVMLMVGINNVSCHDTAEDIAAGIRAVLDLIARKQPQATVLLLPIFPSGPSAEDKRRLETEKANRLIRTFADGEKVVWVDFNAKWLDAQGDVKWVMPDRVHPNAEGYRTIWLPAIRPYLERYCHVGI